MRNFHLFFVPFRICARERKLSNLWKCSFIFLLREKEDIAHLTEQHEKYKTGQATALKNKKRGEEKNRWRNLSTFSPKVFFWLTLSCMYPLTTIFCWRHYTRCFPFMLFSDSFFRFHLALYIFISWYFFQRSFQEHSNTTLVSLLIFTRFRTNRSLPPTQMFPFSLYPILTSLSTGYGKRMGFMSWRYSCLLDTCFTLMVNSWGVHSYLLRNLLRMSLWLTLVCVLLPPSSPTRLLIKL